MAYLNKGFLKRARRDEHIRNEVNKRMKQKETKLNAEEFAKEYARQYAKVVAEKSPKSNK